jgi:hypothetical protein
MFIKNKGRNKEHLQKQRGDHSEVAREKYKLALRSVDNLFSSWQKTPKKTFRKGIVLHKYHTLQNAL